MNYTINFKLIERIPHIIMMNSFFIPDPGLYQGQMGIAIAMAKLYQQTENEVFLDFSYELLDQVISKVNKQLSFSLNEGLAGIGWGIEFFIQNDLVEGTGVEICEEIDYKIMETDPRRITDISLDTGFEGLLHYVIYHLQGVTKQNTRLPFDERYLSDLYLVCIRLKEQDTKSVVVSLLDIYMMFYTTQIIKGYNTSIIDFVPVGPTDLSHNIPSSLLGLKNGLAGRLLKIIFAK